MSFEPRNFDQIVTALQARSASALTDFEVGSVARTMYESFAYEIALLYEKMNLVYLSAFIDSAEGQQLDMVVAALGVRRGLPDYATGAVSFLRDVGNIDIVIPVNTLVATEDTENKPRLVYQTLEPAVLPSDSAVVDVRVQAIEAGDAQATEAQTITVMPHPIPGIKAVSNREAIRFTGKRRETDVELKERAKNALLASGKATLVSLEDGLLSLPRVKDVKVRENFRYARGQVYIALTELNQEKVIEKHFRLTATGEKGAVKTFEVMDSVIISQNSAEFVNIQALDEGGSGEIAGPEKQVWTLGDREGNLIEGVDISNPAPILLRDFGIVEVFVDGIDFNNNAEVSRIRNEIERLRAAGVFVVLKEVAPVRISGFFKIELNESMGLTADDQIRLEGEAAEAIRQYILERHMGQPIITGQIIKNVLSVPGIENLDDFTLSVTRKGVAIQRSGVIKREEAEEFERFYPEYICVASEIKPLPISIQFQAGNLERDYENTTVILGEYFRSLGPGSSVSKATIIEKLREAAPELLENSVQLLPQFWCERAPYKGEDVLASFVELPQINNIFGYSTVLEISGALRLTLPTNINETDRQATVAEVLKQVNNYLDTLKPETALEFSAITELAQKVPPVLAADINPADFVVNAGGREIEGRVSNEKIEVQKFEKPVIPYLCVTGRTELVQIELEALEITATVSVEDDDSRSTATIISETELALLAALRSAYTNFLAQPEVGKSVSYAAFRRALEVSIPDVTSSIDKFSLRATSLADKRLQQTPVEQDGTFIERDIYIRSVEIASLLPFNEKVVKFTTTTNVVVPDVVTIEATSVVVAATIYPASETSAAKTDSQLKKDTQTLVKQAVLSQFNNLPKPDTGESISIATLKQNLITSVSEVTYLVTDLKLTATSARDNRVQTTPQTVEDIAVDTDIEIRSWEVASYKTLKSSKVTVNVTIER